MAIYTPIDKTPENCHRYLLAEILRKLGENEGVCVIDEGERPLLEKNDESLKDKSEGKFFPAVQQESLF
ncbi:MAG: hypothetical protein HZB30_06140 [Nitrospirae bacterium]|nr:hypothetical protein [Nitrospirota bacterium]